MPLRQFADQPAHLPDLVRIQPDRRLVQDQQLRIVYQRFRQTRPLAISFRQLPDDPPPNVLQPAKLLHFLHTAPDVPPTHTLQLRAETKILIHPHLRIQRDVFRHVSDPPPDFHGLCKHIESRDRHAPRRCGKKAGQNPHRRRLPRAVRTKQPHDFSARHLERHVVHGFATCESL